MDKGYNIPTPGYIFEVVLIVTYNFDFCAISMGIFAKEGTRVIQGVQRLILILQSGLMDKNMQVKFSSKVSLKS